MDKLDKTLEELLTTITFDCMCNSNNRAFYIKNLTKERVQSILADLPEQAHRIFFNAYFAVCGLYDYHPEEEAEFNEIYNNLSNGRARNRTQRKIGAS